MGIYYVTGDGKEQVSMSPVIEKLKGKGYDVLYACEPLDEIMFESLREYEGKNIVDAAKENLDLGEDTEESKKKKEELNEAYKPVIEYLEVLLKGKIQKVSVSDLLTDSPAALVQGAYGISPSMQRYMKTQAVAAGGNADGLGQMNQAILEINPNHIIVKDLERMIKVDKESEELERFALLMYDVASLTSGYNVGDAKAFATRVMNLMDAQVDESVKEAEVEAPTATEEKKEEKEEKKDDDDEEDK